MTTERLKAHIKLRLCTARVVLWKVCWKCGVLKCGVLEMWCVGNVVCWKCGVEMWCVEMWCVEMWCVEMWCVEMWCVEIRRHEAELRHLRCLNGSYKLSNFVGLRDKNARNRNK